MEQTLGSLFVGYTIPTMSVSKARSYREEMITKFWDKLHGPYQEFTGRRLTPRTVALKLGHVRTDELEFFYKKCCEARNFSEWFWGRLKIKQV